MATPLDVGKGDALPAVEKRITQDMIASYAAASGDYNPIHIDPEFASTSRFGGTIAHGMLVAAAISQAMTAAFREHWLEAGRLKLRFKAPVRPGDTVTSFGQVKRVNDRDGLRELVCSVGVRKQDGEVAVAGEAAVTIRLA